MCQKAGLAPTTWKEDNTSLTTFEGRGIVAPFNQRIGATDVKTTS